MRMPLKICRALRMKVATAEPLGMRYIDRICHGERQRMRAVGKRGGAAGHSSTLISQQAPKSRPATCSASAAPTIVAPTRCCFAENMRT